jgi:hypothetical protein
MNWTGDVNYCPRCGSSLAEGPSFLQEFWVADDTIHYCWCAGCSWRGEIKAVTRMLSLEVVEDDPGPAARDDLELLYHRS